MLKQALSATSSPVTHRHCSHDGALVTLQRFLDYTLDLPLAQPEELLAGAVQALPISGLHLDLERWQCKG